MLRVMPSRKTKPDPKPPGPAPERLKLSGDWEDAVAKSFAKPKPPAKKKPSQKRKG